MIVSPIYFSVDSISDYYSKGLADNLPLMKDIEFKKLDHGGMVITLKTLGIEFSIPKAKVPDTICFIPGMYYNKGNKKWINMGFEGIYSDKKNWKVCGVGVELKGSNASSALNWVREEDESKKEIKHRLGDEDIKMDDSNSYIWQKEIKSKKNGADMTLFGYWAPFEKHSESHRLMSINFYSRNPFKVSYRLLGKK